MGIIPYDAPGIVSVAMGYARCVNYRDGTASSPFQGIRDNKSEAFTLPESGSAVCLLNITGVY
jgi:hypothetical protein